jgi:hypothetical protein
MNLLKKLWQRILAYKRDPGVSDVPDAPDYQRTTVDPLFMEEQIDRPPKKPK